MNIETRKIGDLKPAEYNPRKALTPEDAEYQKIKRSIETFGYVDPIIINKDSTVIGGHQRLSVLADLGYDEIQVVVVDLSKQDERALNIALNKLDGEWDEVKLKDLLLELDADDYDLSLTGFDEQELDDLIELVEAEPGVIEDEADPEQMAGWASEEPRITRGEIWQLGHHRLMCGDSTDMDDVSALMGQEQLDLIITDPPYNVNYEEKASYVNEWRPNENGAMPIANDVLDDDSFYDFLRTAFSNMELAMRNGAAIYVFHADSKGLTFRQAFTDTEEFELKQVLIWEKSHFVLGRQDYQWRHEPVLYGWKKGAAHYFIKDRTQDTVILEDEADFESMKKPELIAYIKDNILKWADRTTVIYEQKPVSNNLHPTMKPLGLIAKFIRNSSRPGWNVGDFFGGSGSTLMAAEQMNRTAFIMELDEHYANVIIRRWEEFTGQKARRLE